MTTIVPTANFEVMTSHSPSSGCHLLTEEESKEFRKKVAEGLIDHLANTGILAEIEAQNEKRKRGEELLKEMAEISNEYLTVVFHSIFSKITPTSEQKKIISDTFIKEDSFTCQRQNGKFVCKINKMKPIIDYLSQHPDVRMCNFRSFKTEVHDIPTLAEYLKTSNITAVGLNSGISEESKALLAEAVAVRNGTLKIFYAA